MTELDGPGYADIEDHGAIGNLKSVALVSRYGSIDWCCFPQLDSPSVFAALLDVRRGGRWRVAPQGAWRRGEQHYHAGTNVLDTVWDTGGSRLVVTDFMPLRGSIIAGGEPQTAPAIHRVLACTGGSCDVVLEWWPRFDYARAATAIECGAGLATAGAGAERLTLEELPPTARLETAPDGGPLVRAAFTMSDGDVLPLCLWYGDTRPQHGVHDWRAVLGLTCATWREWLDSRDQGERCDFAGSWQPLVDRSGLALKLLTFPRTGAIAAAPTTSLPEHIGGVRNWDYRYTWIRDASFTAQALVGLGHAREAIAFLQWAEDVSMRDDGTAGELGLMYTLDGARTMREQELDHLEGYRGSRPVRIGNKAAEQFQLDIYGELLDAAYELVRLGVGIDDTLWRFLSSVADQACARWQEPDYGIWEVRSDPQHFVYSKLMVYVALDRALRLSRRLGLAADTARWIRTRAAVRASILEHGFDTERGAFVQAYGSRALDAANLHIPLVGFLPVEDPRVQSTIDLCMKELTENGLVYRYRTEESDDGLPGHEGAFGLTTFWMVDALALSGRVDEAAQMFEGIAGRVNHVGLYPEEFDTRSGAFLGNFPQAFTHIGLVNSALYLAHAEGRPVPAPAPLGSPEERAEQAEHEAR
jgi:GH15 family glucan-1,4-alpha-glucosidase